MNRTPTATPQPQWPVLAVVLVIALAARVLYLLQAAELPSFTLPYAGLDVELYQRLARQIAAGNLAIDGLPFYFCAPYAYWLGALYALFGDGPWVAPIANVSIGLGTVALLYALTLRLFGSRAAAALAALGAALYGPYLVFDSSGMKTSLGLFLTALGFWLFLHAVEHPRRRNWFIAGVVLALATWFAQPLLLVLGLLLLWLLGGRLGAQPAGDLRGRATAALLLLVGLLLVYAPFAVRNLVVTGEPLPTTAVGGIHLYIGNHAGASGAYTRVPGVRHNPMGHLVDAKRVAERATGQPLSYRAASAYWRQQAMQFAAAHPQEALALLGRKALLALNAYEIPNNASYAFLAQRSALLRLALDFGWLLPLGLAGLLLGLRGASARMPLYLLFGGLLLGLALTLVTWRYRLPLTLALWPAAGYALARGAHWIKARHWWSVAGLSLVLLAGLALSRWPVFSAEQQAEHLRSAEANMGAAGQELRLRRAFDEGSLAPDAVVDGWLRIARTRMDHHDWEGALRALQEGQSRTDQDARLGRAQIPVLQRLGEHERAMALRHELARQRSRPPTRVRVK
jgi:4-amino-4-deoxy-L-arabinose transferase-like glycosyltransferase